MRAATARRGGFTIVEVVVTVTIVSVMLALMLPAIRASHHASMRISCLNNMRQLTLAIQNYEFNYQALPPGVLNPTGPIRNIDEGHHVGWLVSLLPYMEQTLLASTVETRASVYDPVNLSAARISLRTLHCSADPYKTPTGGPGTSSYAGCHHDVEAPIDADNHGVFFLNSRVRQAEVYDGTSSTIYFGEKLISPPEGMSWLAGTRATLRNTGSPINARPPTPEAGAPADFLFVGGFGSYHPGGANFGFGDGSIRFLKNSIDPRVYRLLGHRDDGEMIPGRRD